MAATGDLVTAVTTASDRQDAIGTTTSTTYTATLAGGTACGLAFVAPASGAVLIHNVVNIFNSGAAHGFATIRVRTGGTIGSGTDVVAAADNNALVHNGTTADRHGCAVHVTGLTPGSTYNAQQLFRVDGGTGSFSNKMMVVQGLI